MKKIVAFGAGRKYGNTEVFIKEALMAAEEMGVSVEFIRLNDCQLYPCKDCLRGPCYVKGPGACILKDDGEWLSEKFLDSDGYLFGAPVWSLSPAGIATVFRDRIFGPKMDVAGWELSGGAPDWVKGRVKYRPGALISVGGARTKNWTSLGMATLYTTTFSAQTNVIDFMDVNLVADMGHATIRDDLIERAHKLGQNLAYAVLHPEEPSRWLGEHEPASCPGCRQNLMIYKPDSDYMECAICGTSAKIHITDGKIKLEYGKNDPNDRLTVEGKFTHMREIAEVRETIYEPVKEICLERLKKYKNYDGCVVNPPSKKK